MKKVVAVLVSVSLAMTACSSMNKREIGMITGAGVGATIGVLAGGKKNRAAGALIGVGAGAITGLAIGHYMETRVKNADETAKEYKYEPKQGTMIKIEDVRIVPELVEPGKSAKIIIDYAVLVSDPKQKLDVTEKRFIKIGDKSLTEIGPTMKTRKSGTYSTEQDVLFPSSLSEGTYQLRGEVVVNGKTSTKEAAFEVIETMNSSDGDSLDGVGGFAH